MAKIHTKQVLNYVFMPGILPRMKDLFGSGTGMLAFLIASVFQATRLLPSAHPYVNPQNIRKFGIRDVFAAAGNNLVFDRRHIDQVLVFFTMAAGFILFILQFVAMAASLIIRPAKAGMFTTANPTTDIAFELMDRVFGVPDFFNSCVAQGIACGNQPAITFPTPFNIALQGLFKYYSVGLLLVAVVIFLYYVFVVVVETAQTGTPFGRRFSHIWAPIRLVVALGLLIPISYGLNAGQYIVLEAAKLGSGFATNGWRLFNTGLTNGLGVENASLYPRAKAPDSWPLAKFMYLVNTCRRSYEAVGITDIKPYLIKGGGGGGSWMEVTQGTVYSDALDFFNKGDVIVRFGQPGHPSELGQVKPYCGEISFQTTASLSTGPAAGPFSVQATYFNLVTKNLWAYPGNGGPVHDFALVYTHQYMGGADVACGPGDLSAPGITCTGGAGSDFFSQARSVTQAFFSAAVSNARDTMIAAGGVAVPAASLNRGWGMAGAWYNKLAEINGAYFGAVNSLPTPTLLPLPMQLTMDGRKSKDQNLGSPCEYFTPSRSDGEAISMPDDEKTVGKVLFAAYKAMCTGSEEDVPDTGNTFKSMINLLFGLNGLFTMRENTDIHPLAQLVGLGKGIMDATVRNLFAATFASFGGGILAAMGSTAGIGGFINLASGILVSVTTISLTIGFILYYVLPFLPFMYFFFAVGSWVKTIFEAMVGVPLWALGHMRIDGVGLPGESAVGGYYMIFEIFIRPILTVFGLIGGLIVFTAMTKVLNEVFHLVTDNLAGFDGAPCVAPSGGGGGCDVAASITLGDKMLEFKRDTIDEFFFTIVYTVIVYVMATSSFKMIDQVPSQIIRWMGAGVRTFADDVGDAQQNLTGYLAAGATQMTKQLTDGVSRASGQLGGGLGKALESSKLNGANATGRGDRPGP